MRITTLLLALGIVVGAAGSAAAEPPSARAEAPSSGEAGRPVYRPPTDAPVLDPFRPPPQPWLPGNRGIEYGTVVGAPITAIGPGLVAFAGPVAGRLVVTVSHPDGLRSSYTGLTGIAVSRGDRVVGDQVLGLAAAPFHLGVRRGDQYLDPSLLWGTPVGGGRVFLVPDDGGGAGRRGRDR